MIRNILAFILAAALSIAPARAIINANPVTLGDFQITVAGQQSTPAANIPVTLQGMTALSCQVRFAYGAGGTKTNVYIQTSIDQEQSWFDVANIAFTTSSGIGEINLSGLNAVTTPTPANSLSLADNTTFNGPLGDRLRVVVVSTGTYTGGSLVSANCASR